MLDNNIIKKIEDFVSLQPRSIQEISIYLKKNWRTVDRYVEEIIKEYGSLGKKTFREGTRGALKIVYFTGVERIKSSTFQKELERIIFRGSKREDFNPLDIYQHISDKKREVRIKGAENENEIGGLDKYEEFLMTAKKQVLFFSGNLSFVNFDDGKNKLFDGIEKLVKKGISIKIVSRIGIDGRENVEKMLSLNKKYGKELIEIRHSEQPLRVTVIDDKAMNLKGIAKPTLREHELKVKTFLFYTIYDKDWVKWISNIFWKMFNGGIGSFKRLEEIDKLEKLRE